MLIGQCDTLAPARTHQLEIAVRRIVQVRVVGDEVAVADVEGGAQHAELVQELDRRLHVLFDYLVELDDAVGGMRRHRQLELVRGAHGVLQQLAARGLDLSRHQNAAHPAVGRAVVLFDPRQRGFKPSRPSASLRTRLSRPLSSATQRPQS
jgi:uncharacterized protein YgbK (DUF1537 family)